MYKSKHKILEFVFARTVLRRPPTVTTEWTRNTARVKNLCLLTMGIF